MSVLGARVRELRKSHGWSARELSERSGGSVSRCTISDLEIGRTPDLSLGAALGIARAFGISVEQLAGATAWAESGAAHELEFYGGAA